MDHRGGNGEDGDDEQQELVPVPAIESLEDYLRRYGLPDANGDEQAGGEFNGLNRAEALERVRAEEAYRDEVIKKHQKETSPRGKDATPRLDVDGDVEGAVMSVLLANKTNREVPVQPLLAFCDTAKRMVTSRWRYGARYGVANDSAGEAAEEKGDNDTTTYADPGNKEDGPMELSLIEFDADVVVTFMEVLLALHSHDQKEFGTGDSSRKRRIDDEKDENTSEYLFDLIEKGKIPEHQIVECLKLAHYLQCRIILDTLTSILERSIDSHNCMAICSLADALNLKTLFESSVNFVIDRLDALQGTASLDDGQGETKRASSMMSSSDDDGQEETAEDIWATLPYELRSRVLTMRNVMRSSVIGRGSKVSGLFFSSGREFLGIFRETLRDQKERLAEAKERREEVIRERSEEWVIICERRGRWFNSSSEAKQEFVYGADVNYALEKIEKQSRRLQTLESFYEEQKTIFKSGGFESEISL